MIAINHGQVTALFKEFKDEIQTHWDNMSVRLISLRNETIGVERQYVKLLLTKKKRLISASLQELDQFKDEFDAILTINPSNPQHRKFKDRILYALGYRERRGDFYPSYFRKLGIKSCVYCNAQLCLTVEKSNKDLIAKFQVDHFESKNKYPCLSVALFNLYPVCASCNNIKGVKSVQFKLYSESMLPVECSYKFKIDNAEEVIAKYISNRDPTNIKILFEENNLTSGLDSIDSVFSISGIYNTQVDIVEDLILKAHIYDPTYKETLRENYPDLFPNPFVLHRLLVGSYIEQAEIHRRPMSKFIQDIARQLNLI